MRGIGWVLGVAGVALAIGCGGGGGGSAKDGPSRANLKKIYTGLVLYATDSDDVLPLADWMDGIVPYLGVDQSVLHRPTAPAEGFGYALNSSLVGASVNSLASPNATPTVFESTNLARNVVAAYPNTGLSRNGGVLTVYLSSRIDPPSRLKPTTEQLRATGLSNVKQLATGLIMYSSDNDDRLPQSAWTDTIEPYLGLSRELIKSPMLPDGQFGYAFNQDLLGVQTTTLDFPSAIPMVFDSDLTGRNATGPFVLPNPPRKGGNNVAYADGHGATVGR